MHTIIRDASGLDDGGGVQAEDSDGLWILHDAFRHHELGTPVSFESGGHGFLGRLEEELHAAMHLIAMETAPCFILEDKAPEELMAIQFSENQAREDLHYIDQADSIFGYQKLTGASERKITASLGISKSEVHRCLQIDPSSTEVKPRTSVGDSCVIGR